MTTHYNRLKNINKWIDALEGDLYQQTTGTLRRGDAMCCLGVVCNISDISNWMSDRYIGEKDVLPDEVINWIGLSSPKGKFYFTPAWILSLPERIKNKLESASDIQLDNLVNNHLDTSYTYLTTLNDNGWTFKEIAELIRYNPPRLFNADVVL